MVFEPFIPPYLRTLEKFFSCSHIPVVFYDSLENSCHIYGIESSRALFSFIKNWTTDIGFLAF